MECSARWSRTQSWTLAGVSARADDPDGDAFEGVGVVDAADVEVVDTWHALEDCCDGLGVDVFAADDDHVVAAGHHV